jgi:hypothetical protein
MSKPIFIWRVPAHVIASNTEHFNVIARDLQTKLSDYHVLTMMDPLINSVQFECYNTTNMDTKSFEELKQIVSNTMQDDDPYLNDWDATLNDGLEDL